MRENKQDNSIHHTKFVAGFMGRGSVSTSAVRAKKAIKKRIATSFIRTSVQHPGKLHQRKMQELGVEKGRKIETEVKPEVEIEGGRNPKRLVGGNSLHINPEIGLRE